MKKIIILLLTLAILATAGILIASMLREESIEEKYHDYWTCPEEYPYISIAHFKSLTDQQRKALEELNKREYSPYGTDVHYYREEQTILGNITNEQPRLDKEQVLKYVLWILKDVDDRNLLIIVHERFPYPDAIYRNPNFSMNRTVYEYWIDGDANKKLIVDGGSGEYGGVCCVEYDQDGNEIVRERLYPFEE